MRQKYPHARLCVRGLGGTSALPLKHGECRGSALKYGPF